jgi:hypothetical protein
MPWWTYALTFFLALLGLSPLLLQHYWDSAAQRPTRFLIKCARAIKASTIAELPAVPRQGRSSWLRRNGGIFSRRRSRPAWATPLTREPSWESQARCSRTPEGTRSHRGRSSSSTDGSPRSSSSSEADRVLSAPAQERRMQRSAGMSIGSR